MSTEMVGAFPKEMLRGRTGASIYMYLPKQDSGQVSGLWPGWGWGGGNCYKLQNLWVQVMIVLGRKTGNGETLTIHH